MRGHVVVNFTISAQNTFGLKVLKTKMDLNTENSYLLSFKLLGAAGHNFPLV